MGLEKVEPVRASQRGRLTLDRQRQLAAGTGAGSRVAVVVVPGNPGDMDRTLRSLRAQSWDRWTLRTALPVDADGGERRQVIAASSDTDPWAVDAMLDGVRSDDLVVVLAEGDSLASDCLFEVAAAVSRDPMVQVIGWDDALDRGVGRPREMRVRPSWSADVLLSGPYLGHAVAVRRRAIAAAGGLSAALHDPDLMLWDLLLRCRLGREQVARIPRVLSTVTARRDAAGEEGRAIVGRHLAAMGWEANAVLVDDAVRVRWTGTPPPVTVVIPTRHNRGLLGPLLNGLARTEHPDVDVIVVDNGGRNADNEAWYARRRAETGLRLSVIWWDSPFNYSAVNNAAARGGRSEVLVFLNDDIEVLDPTWLAQLSAWATVDGVGAVGMQLMDPHGLIQHGGVVVGLRGFADHLFQGLRPGERTLLGPTTWYRNTLAVTGACLAMRRTLFERLGGFDERLVLCGSDVVLGLDAHIRGLRTVCLPDHGLRHLESATRTATGTEIPLSDYHLSYWRYQPWLHGGDPYWSPALSVSRRRPSPRRRREPTTLQMIEPVLGRRFTIWRSGGDLELADERAAHCRITGDQVAAVGALHRNSAAPFNVRTVNWYIPGIDSPFYGGINTALRIADHLARIHGVENRFVVAGPGPEPFLRAGIAVAFPTLASAPIHLVDAVTADLAPPADAAVATLWTTAYLVARAARVRRKFYLVQDYEPMFYPAGTMYALAEESYRLGLYALCNTTNLAGIYRRYGGAAHAFMPAVDPSVFHAVGRAPRRPDEPVTLFVYARPGHWRNCWELAQPALIELKERLGERVRIVTAGSWAVPDPSGHMPAMTHLGLLDYRATGELYRRCDIGLALTVSQHPSYLPLELMACGATVVAFDNPAGHWLLRHDENAVLTPRTVDGLVEGLERVAVDPGLRRRLSRAALADIASKYGAWDPALAGIHAYLSNPEGAEHEGWEGKRLTGPPSAGPEVDFRYHRPDAPEHPWSLRAGPPDGCTNASPFRPG